MFLHCVPCVPPVWRRATVQYVTALVEEHDELRDPYRGIERPAG